MTYARGIFAAGDDLRFTFAELAEQVTGSGGSVSSMANIDAAEWGAGFSTQIADVEVDPETGKVTLLRYTVVQDVGQAVHPAMVEGQMQGGAVQGIGWALYEGYAYNDERADAQRQLPRLQNPDGARRADDRDGDRRSAVSQAPVRRARRGRTAHRAAARRDRQRHLSRDRRPPHHLPMTPAHLLEKMGVIESIES